MLQKVCPIIYHMPHKSTPLLFKYLSVTQKEALVSPAGIKLFFCRSHLPFCASQNMLCLAPAVPHFVTAWKVDV